MSKCSPNEPCPCGSERKYKKCCRPIHFGEAAATPEALMRSRYSAYALGLVDHILNTTHPDGPHFEPDTAQWRTEVRAFVDGVRFDGLEVLQAEARGDRGIVDFRAHLSNDEHATVMEERSVFARVDGRWLYHSGTRR